MSVLSFSSPDIHREFNFQKWPSSFSRPPTVHNTVFANHRKCLIKLKINISYVCTIGNFRNFKKNRQNFIVHFYSDFQTLYMSESWSFCDKCIKYTRPKFSLLSMTHFPSLVCKSNCQKATAAKTTPRSKTCKKFHFYCLHLECISLKKKVISVVIRAEMESWRKQFTQFLSFLKHKKNRKRSGLRSH